VARTARARAVAADAAWNAWAAADEAAKVGAEAADLRRRVRRVRGKGSGSAARRCAAARGAPVPTQAFTDAVAAAERQAPGAGHAAGGEEGPGGGDAGGDGDECRHEDAARPGGSVPWSAKGGRKRASPGRSTTASASGPRSADAPKEVAAELLAGGLGERPACRCRQCGCAEGKSVATAGSPLGCSPLGCWPLCGRRRRRLAGGATKKVLAPRSWMMMFASRS